MSRIDQAIGSAEERMKDPQTLLLIELQALIEQLRRPAVSPADELWTIADIATYIKLSADTTERRVVTRPDFPAPVQPCPGGQKAQKRYFADEVIKWARQNRGSVPKGRVRRKDKRLDDAA
ncbi:hypothetical protein D9M70_245830 [compost metagenome]